MNPIILIATCCLMLLPACATAQQDAAGEIKYRSSADDTNQPAVAYIPKSGKPVPMIVALHTWSHTYQENYHQDIETWCVENGWAYIHPHFRGPNTNPEACGSELVVKDIVSAVEHMKGAANIDASAIYLVGTSGGGYASLLMAGRHPEIWAGVSAWVPISDLAAWYEQTKNAKRNYFRDLMKVCGGAPGDSEEVDEQYRKRSAITYLAHARDIPIHINAGIHDGHTGSVPVSHSLIAFNALADEADQITDAQIRSVTEHRQVPDTLKRPIEDPTFGDNPPLFRRSSHRATITLFEGGHELVPTAALAWIQQQYQARQVKESD